MDGAVVIVITQNYVFFNYIAACLNNTQSMVVK